MDVYEFIHPTGSVMKRKNDNWVNATHILKAANFAKAKRTRILEKEVIKGIHEKVQGGFGKYQGTWVPLNIARSLATKFEVNEELKILFDFLQSDGSASPPPAPKHHHASRTDSTRKKAFKSNSTSTLLDKTKKVTESSESSLTPTIPKKRGRPPSAQTKAKRKLGVTTIQRSQSDVGFPKPSIPNSSISATQLPSILSEEVSRQHSLSQHPIQSQSHSQMSLSQQSQFKELDLNDGLSSDVEQHQYLPEDDNFGDVANFVNEHKNKQDIGESGRYSSNYQATSPTASTPTLPTSPSELSDTAPFDNRYGIGTSPVLSTIPRYLTQVRPDTSDINDKVNSYLSKLVEYFTSNEMKSNNNVPRELLLPPHSSAPYIDAPIDPELHSAFHWACSMGNLPIVEALYDVGTNIRSTNSQGQTPLMRSVMFHNCYTRRSFPRIFQLLHETVFDLDSNEQTIIHHIIKRKSSTPSAVYYLDLVLSKVKDYSPQYRIDILLNSQDINGDTALHIAAMNRDSLFCDTLLNNGAANNISNKQHMTASEIKDKTVCNNESQINGNELVEAFVISQIGKKKSSNGFKCKSAESIDKKMPEFISIMKSLAEQYNDSFVQTEKDIKMLEKTIKNINISIKNVDVRTAEVLKISNINEINQVIMKHSKTAGMLHEKIDELKRKIINKFEKTQNEELLKYVNEEEEGNRIATRDNHGDARLLSIDLSNLQRNRKLRIEEIINTITDNGKIHKYRKMISEGTGISSIEVDGCLDIILQTLNNEKNALI